MAKIEWRREANDPTWVASLPGNITLFAGPDRRAAMGTKAARGTTWRAGASQWDEATRTLSRVGPDRYNATHKTADDAKRAAEAIYMAHLEAAE